jgi:hypothetical protein
VGPFYEQVVSGLDRSMHRSLWVQVAHSLFIEGSHMTKTTASGAVFTRLFFLLRLLRPNKLVLQYIWVDRFARDKSTNSLGPFVSYEENMCETWVI